MKRRTKIIIIAVLVLLFLLGVLLMLLLHPSLQPVQQKNVIPPNLNSNTNAASLNVTSGTNVNRPPLADQVAPPPAPATAQAAPSPATNISRIAMAFAERFGSYSNQSGYQNITDLKAFMSANMIKWADSYVANAQAQSTAGSTQYTGITTRAISDKVNALDDKAGTATVTVSTQRQKRQGLSFSSDIYYQDLVLTFVKENDSWKVDSATWQGQ